MNQGTVEIFEDWLSSKMEVVHTILPGKIESYYGHDERKAKVKPLVNFYSRKGPKIEIPVIDNVPVVFPSSADFSMLWPLAAGDGCLLLFSECAMGNMKNGDGEEVVDPENFTRFNLMNCICIPGLWSFSAAPAASDNDDDFSLSYKGKQIIIKKDSDEISLKTENGADLTVKDGNIELNGNSKKFVTYSELNTALQTFMTALGTHVHATAAPGAPSPPTVPMTLDISAAETATIKTGG